MNIKKITLYLLFFLSFMQLLYAEQEFRKGSFFDTSIALDVLKETTLSVPQDLYNITVTPFEHPQESLTALGIVGGLVLVDHPTTVFYQEYIEKPLDFYTFPVLFPNSPLAPIMGFHSDTWMTYGMVFHYLGGFIFGDEKSQVTSILAGKAIVYSFTFSHLILKTMFARNRPSDNLATTINPVYPYTTNPLQFGNWHIPYIASNQEGTSMPSFHTTMFFSVAKVYADMYDNYWLPYAFVALLYASDIKGHNHWVSDLVAGGILGTFIGGQVINSYKGSKQIQNNSIIIMPYANGIMLQYVFSS